MAEGFLFLLAELLFAAVDFLEPVLFRPCDDLWLLTGDLSMF